MCCIIFYLAEVWKKEQNFGDLACMLSHLLLWKRIAEEPGIHIVFEDDADVKPVAANDAK
jgi:GR25 family glycosyltransferase involved in LPS biosynthesis